MIKCENCKFFKATPLQGKEVGQCRCNAPQVFPVPSHNGIGFVTSWPSVQGVDEGCGKGEPKLNDCN